MYISSQGVIIVQNTTITYEVWCNESFFAETSRKLRAEKELSRQELAGKMFVTHSMVDPAFRGFGRGCKSVPFADELKHTQAYLAMEKAQHEDNLNVETG